MIDVVSGVRLESVRKLKESLRLHNFCLLDFYVSEVSLLTSLVYQFKAIAFPSYIQWSPINTVTNGP